MKIGAEGAKRGAAGMALATRGRARRFGDKRAEARRARWDGKARGEAMRAWR